MAINSINGLSPAAAGGTTVRAPATSAPPGDSTLRAELAAAEGAGTRPIDPSRSVNASAKSAPNGDPARQKTPDDQLLEAVAQLNDFVKNSPSDLQFSVDKESGMRIIKVVDAETKEVIRQIPAEEIVEIAKAISRLQGLLIRQTA